MSHLQAAFDKVCADAKTPEQWYVALMESVPFFGGAEEGGWWGEDEILVAYQDFPNETLANAAKDQVEKLAEKLERDALREYGDQCLRECDQLEARGLDADYYPEPDGPSKFYVIVSETLPVNQFGCRQYS